MTTTNAPPLALRRQPRFTRWFVADTSTRVAASLTTLVMPLLAVSVLSSPTQAGFVVAAAGVGASLGLLPGGVLADLCDRRLVVLGCAVTSVLLYLLVSLTVNGGSTTPAVLAALLLGIGLCSTLSAPAFTATLKGILDPRQFGSAVSATEGRSAAIALVMPALGAAMFGAWAVLPFLLAAAAVAVSAATFFRVGDTRSRGIDGANDRSCERPRQAAPLAGLRFVLGHPVLRPLLVAGMLVNVVGSAVLATVVFQLHRQGSPPATIGLLGTAVAIGALCGAAVSPMLLARVRSGVLLIVGLTWIAAWLLPLIVTDSPALIIVFVAVGTFAAPAVNAVMGGCTVAAVPAQLQGRADAAISFTSTLAMPLAPIIAGVGIEHLGFQPTVLALAVLVQLSILPCVISSPVRQLSTAADWPREA